jgi:uncharacterized protein YjbI with pentapeptide repeats
MLLRLVQDLSYFTLGKSKTKNVEESLPLIVNLFCYLNLDLSGYDFSGLKIWHCNLQKVCLHRVNFKNADLSKSIFVQTLESALCVRFSPEGDYLATADADGQVYQCISSLAFSPDGQSQSHQ